MNQISLRNFYLPIAVLTVCFATLYFQVIANLVTDWTINDNYSHGFLIPFISGYLIWENRARLSDIPLKPSKLAIPGGSVLAGGLALFVLTNIAAEQFTMRVSMLVVLLGLVMFVGGWELGKNLSLPIGYMIFMIPLPAIIWNKIAFPLKLFATTISVSFMHFLAISAYREGNVIHLANTSLEVVDACSGLRSLTSLLALSAAFALISHHSKTRKWILFLSAVPIAIVVNVVRLTATAILAEHYGARVAHGFLHDVSGILVFVMAFVLLYAVHLFLQKTFTQKIGAN
ncbi:MAG: exosortase [Deltaproteobacteria bacterium]|nr:exosortase [Deltaproteobacteria bacterium]